MSEDTQTDNRDGDIDASEWTPLDACRRPFDLDLPLLLLPFAIVASVMGLLPLRNWDYWWHISVGRVIDVFGAVPDQNHYLYTLAEDAPSFIQPWLAEWIMVWFHDIGGIYVGLTLRNLVAAVAFTIMGAVAARRSGSPLTGAAFGVFGFLVASPTLFAGPAVFATLIFAVVVAVAYAVRDDVLPRPALVVLPLAAALWANIDLAFLAPAVVAFVFLLGTFLGGRGDERFSAGDRVAWSLTLLLCVATPLLNPRGVELYSHLATLVLDSSQRSMIPYGLSIGDYTGQWTGIAYYLGFFGVVVLTPLGRDKLDRTDLTFFLVVASIVFWSARMLPLFGVVICAAAARNAATRFPALARRPSSSGGGIKAVLLAMLLVSVGFGMQRFSDTQDDFVNSIQPFEAREEPPLAGVVPPETPVVHTEILDGLAMVPRIYHDKRYAGFLLHHIADAKPAPLVFVDPRVELPPDEIWELYSLINRGEAWRGAFQQFGVNTAMLNRESQSKLIDEINQRDDWELAYQDDYNVLFVRE